MDFSSEFLVWSCIFITFSAPLCLMIHTLFCNWRTYRFYLKTLPRAPFPSKNPFSILLRGHELLKHVFDADSGESAQFFNSLRRVLGSDVFVVTGPSLTSNVIVYPEAAVRTIAQNSSTFVKPWSIEVFLNSFVGNDSIFVSDGSRHRRLRQTISTSLKHDNLMMQSQLFIKHGDALAHDLASARDEDPLLSIRRATFGIIVNACFGENVVEDKTVDNLLHLYHNALSRSTGTLMIVMARYMGIPFTPPAWLFASERYKAALREEVHQLCATIMERKRDKSKFENNSSIKNGASLLSIMCDACEDGHLTAEDLVQIVLSLLLAGQATTTIGSGWAFYYLATHQEWQARLHEEIKNNWKVTDELTVLDRLPLLDRVVRETIRIRPPVQSALRMTLKDVEIDGHSIPAGTFVRVPIAAIQRRDDFWGADADIFNPDRFIKLDGLPETRWMWMAFWFGSHNCVGQRFAMLEMKTFIAMMVLKFHMSVDESAGVQSSSSESDQLKKVLKLHYSRREELCS